MVIISYPAMTGQQTHWLGLNSTHKSISTVSIIFIPDSVRVKTFYQTWLAEYSQFWLFVNDAMRRSSAAKNLNADIKPTRLQVAAVKRTLWRTQVSMYKTEHSFESLFQLAGHVDFQEIISILKLNNS